MRVGGPADRSPAAATSIAVAVIAIAVIAVVPAPVFAIAANVAVILSITLPAGRCVLARRAAAVVVSGTGAT